MKLATCLLTAALAVGLAPAWGSVAASAKPTQRNQQASQTFTGELARNPDNRNLQDQYVLYDAQAMTNYFVEGSQDLDRYVGHSIEVTGSFDPANHTIRVASLKQLK